MDKRSLSERDICSKFISPALRDAVVLPDGSLFGEGVKTRLNEHLMQECNLHTNVRLPNSVFRPYASADDHGDPGTLLAELDAAEAEAAKLRDQLKAILAEALVR